MKPLFNTWWKRDVRYTSLPLNYSRFLTISSKVSQIDGLIIKLYELLLSFGFIGPAILSITSRCLTLAFAFRGESKNSDETRPGKFNAWDTLKLKADTLKWRLKISKPNLVLLLFDSSHLIVAFACALKKRGEAIIVITDFNSTSLLKKETVSFSNDSHYVTAWHGEVNYLSIKDTTAACGAHWNWIIPLEYIAVM